MQHMRKIPLIHTTTGEDNPYAPNLAISYGEMIVARVSATPDGGLTLEQIENALTVRRLVREAEAIGVDHVLLPETAWAYLNKRMQEGGWALVDEVVLAVVKAVREAPSVAA